MCCSWKHVTLIRAGERERGGGRREGALGWKTGIQPCLGMAWWSQPSAGRSSSASSAASRCGRIYPSNRTHNSKHMSPRQQQTLDTHWHAHGPNNKQTTNTHMQGCNVPRECQREDVAGSRFRWRNQAVECGMGTAWQQWGRHSLHKHTRNYKKKKQKQKKQNKTKQQQQKTNKQPSTSKRVCPPLPKKELACTMHNSIPNQSANQPTY